MNKIILAGLTRAQNLGDRVIYDSAKYLYENEVGDKYNFDPLDLMGYKNKPKNYNYIKRRVRDVLYRLFGLFGRQGKLKDYEIKQYYKDKIKGSSLIVLVGGGLIKYKYEDFWKYLNYIITSAEKRNIPVVLNAVGIEDFDIKNDRCKFLTQALNLPNVKAITTRDDIETLEKGYLKNNSHVFIEQVADSAVWASSVYNVQRDKNSELIGVGLVRGGIFQDNERDLSPKEVAELYVSIFKELDRRGIKWEAFTNGLKKDMELVETIFTKLGQPEKINKVKQPLETKELIEVISKYKGVIAARLHANIISYALNIPSVGLVWNDKLTYYGQIIGYPKRFVSIENFNPSYIVNQLETAVREGYDQEKRQAYKDTVVKSIRKILRDNNLI